jgi:hypothetical protein
MRHAALGPTCHGYVIERIWLHLFGEPFLLSAPAATRSVAELRQREGKEQKEHFAVGAPAATEPVGGASAPKLARL